MIAAWRVCGGVSERVWCDACRRESRSDGDVLEGELSRHEQHPDDARQQRGRTRRVGDPRDPRSAAECRRHRHPRTRSRHRVRRARTILNTHTRTIHNTQHTHSHNTQYSTHTLAQYTILNTHTRTIHNTQHTHSHNTQYSTHTLAQYTILNTHTRGRFVLKSHLQTIIRQAFVRLSVQALFSYLVSYLLQAIHRPPGGERQQRDRCRLHGIVCGEEPTDERLVFEHHVQTGRRNQHESGRQ